MSAIRSTADIPGPDGVPQPCETPRALETDEIAGVIAEYRQAALNAIEAGCDGVELHCSSGYLPMQFLCSGSNQRTDQYGGSAENRIRFVVETLQALSEAVGAARVGYRICPGNPYNDMHDDDWAGTFGTLLRATDGMGLAYVHLIDRPTPELDTLALVKDNWTGPLIVNDSLNFEKGQALLTAGKADAVSYGRPFISNPDLVERFRRGAPLARQDRSTFYTGEARGYIDYPTLEEEG
jgi:N-ethylmaleimide reductase